MKEVTRLNLDDTTYWRRGLKANNVLLELDGTDGTFYATAVQYRRSRLVLRMAALGEFL